MLDVIAAIAFGAMFAADVTIRVSLMIVPLTSKVAASLTAAAWVVAIGIPAIALFGYVFFGPWRWMTKRSQSDTTVDDDAANVRADSVRDGEGARSRGHWTRINDRGCWRSGTAVRCISPCLR